MWILRKAKVTDIIDGDVCIRPRKGNHQALCFKELKTEGVTTSVLAYVKQSTGRRVGYEIPRFMVPMILSDNHYVKPEPVKVDL